MIMEYTPAFFDRLFDAIAPRADELLKEREPQMVTVDDIDDTAGDPVEWNPDSTDPPSEALLNYLKRAVAHRLTREIVTNPRARGGFIWMYTSRSERKRELMKREKNVKWEKVKGWLMQDDGVFKKNKKNKNGTPIPADEVEKLGREFIKMIHLYAITRVNHLLGHANGDTNCDETWTTDSSQQWRLAIVEFLYDNRSTGKLSIHDRIEAAKLAMPTLDKALAKSEQEVEPNHDPASVFASDQAKRLLFENQSTWLVWILVDIWRNGGFGFSIPSHQLLQGSQSVESSLTCAG